MSNKTEYNYAQMTNKELEELVKEAEEVYNEALKIVTEHYNLMENCAEVYSNAITMLDKRTNGKWSKKYEQEKDNE